MAVNATGIQHRLNIIFITDFSRIIFLFRIGPKIATGKKYQKNVVNNFRILVRNKKAPAKYGGFSIEDLNGYLRPLAIGDRATFPPLSM